MNKIEKLWKKQDQLYDELRKLKNTDIDDIERCSNLKEYEWKKEELVNEINEIDRKIEKIENKE